MLCVCVACGCTPVLCDGGLRCDVVLCRVVFVMRVFIRVSLCACRVCRMRCVMVFDGGCGVYGVVL